MEYSFSKSVIVLSATSIFIHIMMVLVPFSFADSIYGISLGIMILIFKIQFVLKIKIITEKFIIFGSALVGGMFLQGWIVSIQQVMTSKDTFGEDSIKRSLLIRFFLQSFFVFVQLLNILKSDEKLFRRLLGSKDGNNKEVDVDENVRDADIDSMKGIPQDVFSPPNSDVEIYPSEIYSSREIPGPNTPSNHSIDAELISKVFSHHIRTPLNQAQGMIEFINQELKLRPSIRSKLEMALSALKRTEYRLSDISDYAKIINESFILYEEEFILSEFLLEIKEVVTPFLSQQKIRLEIYSDPQLIIIVADRKRLSQVLHTLIHNAAKHTRRGTIKISVKKKETNIYFQIKDNGKGYKSKFQKSNSSIFSDQSQEIMDIMNFDSGGLHLNFKTTLAFKIIEKMHSILRVRPTHGGGTTFLFNLQFASSSQSIHKDSIRLETDLPEPPNELHTLSEEIYCPSSKVVGRSSLLFRSKPLNKGVKEMNNSSTIFFVVDDDHCNRFVQTQLIKNHGFHYKEASNGKEAIAILSNFLTYNNPEKIIIIMDIEMPEMDGIEATKAIRFMQSNLSEIIIIGCSANSSDTVKNDALKAGMNNFFLKPFTITTLNQIKAQLQI